MVEHTSGQASKWSSGVPQLSAKQGNCGQVVGGVVVVVVVVHTGAGQSIGPSAVASAVGTHVS